MEDDWKKAFERRCGVSYFPFFDVSSSSLSGAKGGEKRRDGTESEKKQEREKKRERQRTGERETEKDKEQETD